MNTKTKLHGHIILFSIILLFLFLTSYIEEVCASANATQVTENGSLTGKHDVYIDWILNKSCKISRSMAADIYNAAMSIENGLLLIAMAESESSFNPTAISPKGAVGLNQIMPDIWIEELREQKIIQEKRDLFDYRANLIASNYILTKYYKLTGSWKKALIKYVGGSESYAKDVLANYGELNLLTST